MLRDVDQRGYIKESVSEGRKLDGSGSVWRQRKRKRVTFMVGEKKRA